MKTLKRTIGMLMAVIIGTTFTACGENEENTYQTESRSSAAESVNENNSAGTTVYKTLYDPGFSIEYMEDGIKKVLDGDGRELILVPRSIAKVPEEYSEKTVIRTPVENAVLLSTTQVCTFRTVDDPAIISNIGGVTGGVDEWSYIPPIKSALEKGDIINVGGDGMGDPDFELIQSLDPDLVFVYSGEFGQQGIMSKLDELGINYAVDNEYLESDYLARMEWMSFLLTFFDADDKANAAMANVQANINKVKSEIEELEKPSVAIFNIYSGTVYATDGASWVGSMAHDMGSENVFDGTPVINITYEAAYECISKADVIIYSGIADSMADLSDVFPQITECKAYEENRVYCYEDNFWYGIDQSDIIACDMAAVFYPDVFADRELSYFTHLEK